MEVCGRIYGDLVDVVGDVVVYGWLEWFWDVGVWCGWVFLFLVFEGIVYKSDVELFDVWRWMSEDEVFVVCFVDDVWVGVVFGDVVVDCVLYVLEDWCWFCEVNVGELWVGEYGVVDLCIRVWDEVDDVVG